MLEVTVPREFHIDLQVNGNLQSFKSRIFQHLTISLARNSWVMVLTLGPYIFFFFGVGGLCKHI